jgi:hypothetical protein
VTVAGQSRAPTGPETLPTLTWGDSVSPGREVRGCDRHPTQDYEFLVPVAPTTITAEPVRATGWPWTATHSDPLWSTSGISMQSTSLRPDTVTPLGAAT